MNIKIENLTKTYGHQKAVDHISFQVKTGEILGFLGPNGAGKTTTMKIITQFIEADTGEVYIDGKSIAMHESKKNIGYLPESNALYTEMPVIDYLDFCARLQGIANSDIPDRVKQMVKVCGLDIEKHKKIGELSKGYRQRVGLAQAMIHDPEILILDEPTTGLDPNQIVEIRELIKKLGKQKTVILSTHILPEVEATCDRILIINRGRIVADGTANTLRKQAQGNQILRIKVEGGDTDQIFKALKAIPRVQMVDLEAGSTPQFDIQSEVPVNRNVFEVCVKNNWVLTEMIPLETKLEDIFRELTMN